MATQVSEGPMLVIVNINENLDMVIHILPFN